MLNWRQIVKTSRNTLMMTTVIGTDKC